MVVKNGAIPSGLGYIHRGYMYAIHPHRDAGAIVKLGPGDFYGELGLVRGMPSPIIIQTVTNCEVWVFNRKSYLRLLEHLPQETKQQILLNYLDILKVVVVVMVVVVVVVVVVVALVVVIIIVVWFGYQQLNAVIARILKQWRTYAFVLEINTIYFGNSCN